MKKTPHYGLALAALLALTAGQAAAQSSVQLTGMIDLFAGERQLAGRAKLKMVESGGLTTSRWGVEGSEDLGGGLKADFALSGFVRGDTGEAGRFPTDGFWSRAAWVGVRGNFGTVRAGRIGTPSFAQALRYNPFADSTALSPYMLHTNTGGQPLASALAAPDGQASNALAYTLPTTGGFNLMALYALGEATGASAGNRYNVGGSWAGGPLAVGASVEDSKVVAALPAGVTHLKNTQIGSSFDAGVVKLFGQVCNTRMDLAASTRKLATWQLGLSVPAGAGAVLLSMARTQKTETALADVTRSTVALGYDHPLSKRTDLYAVLLQDKLTAVADGRSAVVGVRHRF